MRGVIEEKTSRIVEVIISSVKPFQLMMGKIIGIAGVGLTQIALWVVLSTVISTVVFMVLGVEGLDSIKGMENAQTMGSVGALKDVDTKTLSGLKMLATIDFSLIFGCFIFYFIFGYLMYGALFGAVGAAVDNETDTQQFMLPITIPLILSIALSGAIIANPHSNFSVWASIFPLTSPVVMMIRLPFIGFSWELLLSMSVLVISFMASTWLAAKIYRIGILLYGKKPTYKELVKWLFSNH